ncbi:MAG: hypothetical protein HQ521_15160 [Bacteroidetes bacterium]|nr:hypothetical protein [Bacteroidota bacterium]
MRLLVRKYSILYSALIFVFVIVNVIGTDSMRRVFIDGDGSGHYAYLPSLVINHSVDFGQVFEFEKQQRPPDYMGHYFHKHGDIFIDKYTSGTALLQLPFFLLAYLLSVIFGFSPDGYNVIFQYSIAIATLFWVGLGITYFVKLLSLYGIDKRFSWLMAGVTLFGTNLFLYTFIQPSFTHAYSFSIITIFLYFARKIFIDYEKRSVLIASFIFGIIVLIRPANILIVAALPFIAGTQQKFFNSIRQKLSNYDFIIAVLIFILAISPQLVINYLQTGSLIIYGYKDEGFYFSDPQFFNFLFSYKKGWFIYTPLFLFLIPAILFLWHRTKYEFLTFLGFLAFLIYILSSWWNWYYGDSFGMRPMVDYYGLFMLIIALLISKIRFNWLISATTILILLFTILNIIQSYQYAVGIIHPDSMTKKSYWHVFLKLDKDYKNIIASGDETYYGSLSEIPFFSTHDHIESFGNGWNEALNTNSELWFSDSLSVLQSEEFIYSPSFRYFIQDSLVGLKNIYVRFNTRYLEETENAAIGAVFVVDITDVGGENNFYKVFRIKPLPDEKLNTWQKGSIGFKLPEITGNMDQIKFYVWNVEKQAYLLDDLSLEFYIYDTP